MCGWLLVDKKKNNAKVFAGDQRQWQWQCHDDAGEIRDLCTSHTFRSSHQPQRHHHKRGLAVMAAVMVVNKVLVAIAGSLQWSLAST